MYKFIQPPYLAIPARHTPCTVCPSQRCSPVKSTGLPLLRSAARVAPGLPPCGGAPVRSQEPRLSVAQVTQPGLDEWHRPLKRTPHQIRAQSDRYTNIQTYKCIPAPSSVPRPGKLVLPGFRAGVQVACGATEIPPSVPQGGNARGYSPLHPQAVCITLVGRGWPAGPRQQTSLARPCNSAARLPGFG